MPVKVKKVGNKFRVVEAREEKVAKNAAGTAVDGGGHGSKTAAVAQAQAMNLAEMRRKGDRRAPPRRKK